MKEEAQCSVLIVITQYRMNEWGGSHMYQGTTNRLRTRLKRRLFLEPRQSNQKVTRSRGWWLFLCIDLVFFLFVAGLTSKTNRYALCAALFTSQTRTFYSEFLVSGQRRITVKPRRRERENRNERSAPHYVTKASFWLCLDTVLFTKTHDLSTQSCIDNIT